MGEPISQPVMSERTVASPSAAFWRAPERAASSPLPAALGPTLGATAGVLVALGGLGTWVRVAVSTGGATQAPADTIVGRAEGGGWALLVLGVLAAVGSMAWAAQKKELRRAGAWAAALVLVAATWSVVAIDRRAAALTSAAAQDPSFDSYHTGFGWGAWLLLLAAILAALTLLVGWLRSIDLGRQR